MLSIGDPSDFLERNLGGQMYWQMLRDHGLSADAIKELLEFHLSDRREVIEFMGGEELYNSLSPHWREATFVLSTLRYLCEWLSAWRPRATQYLDVSEYFKREEVEQETGAIDQQTTDEGG